MLTLVEVQATTAAIDARERLAPMIFLLGLDELGSDGFVVTVDDGGGGFGAPDACNGDDNSAGWIEDACN